MVPLGADMNDSPEGQMFGLIAVIERVHEHKQTVDVHWLTGTWTGGLYQRACCIISGVLCGHAACLSVSQTVGRTDCRAFLPDGKASALLDGIA